MSAPVGKKAFVYRLFNRNKKMNTMKFENSFCNPPALFVSGAIVISIAIIISIITGVIMMAPPGMA